MNREKTYELTNEVDSRVQSMKYKCITLHTVVEFRA